MLGQAAVAIAAVAIAGAALQTFVRLSRADVGFSTAGVTLVDISVPSWKYDSAASTRQLSSACSCPFVKQLACRTWRRCRCGRSDSARLRKVFPYDGPVMRS